jgi:hypothetical protein
MTGGDDWTAVRVKGDPTPWGYLDLVDTTVKVNDYVNIVQHPSGLPKQIALYHNVVAYADDSRVQYLTDTEPGSSGSPVFDSHWRVVAIHQGVTASPLCGHDEECLAQVSQSAPDRPAGAEQAVPIFGVSHLDSERIPRTQELCDLIALVPNTQYHPREPAAYQCLQLPGQKRPEAANESPIVPRIGQGAKVDGRPGLGQGRHSIAYDIVVLAQKPTISAGGSNTASSEGNKANRTQSRV